MYKNMMVTMHMAAPVVVSGFLYLDGILAAAVMKEKLGETYFDMKPDESKLIEVDLPLEKRFGVWCTSIGYGDNREFVGSWTKRWDNKNDDIVNFGNKGKVRVDIACGYFKNYHMPLVIKSYKTITFYARGDVKEVERLLMTYITHIGKKASQGYGEILNFTVEKIAEDYSLVKNGKPTRPIPIDADIKFEDDVQLFKHALLPPYWRTDNLVACYMPT